MTVVMGRVDPFYILYYQFYGFMERFLRHTHLNTELFEQLSAFNLYKSHGLETACSVYPQQREFILAHRDQTLEEVRRERYRELERMVPPSERPIGED